MKPLYVLLLILPGILSQINEECSPRKYNESSIVCVCNSTYCDYIPRPEKIDSPKFYKFTSNEAGLRFQREINNFVSAIEDDERNVITIDTNQEFQKILGWGGAFTDSTGINIGSLNELSQENLLKSYFSEDGLEYNLCRVPMGGTDFSTRAYSYDDGDIDEKLINWKLSSDDFNYKIPFIKKAFNLTGGNLKLFTSTWTAPKWMKTNNDYNGFGFLIDTYYQTWADYFVKFLDAYKDEGISFWGITTGNEPYLDPISGTQINSVGWTPHNKGVWIENNLGPTIRASNHSHIKIMTLDDQTIFLPWTVEEELINESARNYIDGIGIHWYMDTLLTPNVLTATHEKFPEKFILSTEACAGYNPFDNGVRLGSWQRGEDYAYSIIQDVNNWVTGWVDWNMVLNTTGGPTYINNIVDSPIIVNASSKEFYKQPTFYTMGHFSKFIPRDSVRVFSSGFNEDNIKVAAFKRPDNASVLVVLNLDEKHCTAKIYDQAKNQQAKVILTAKSITTVLYW